MNTLRPIIDPAPLATEEPGHASEPSASSGAETFRVSESHGVPSHRIYYSAMTHFLSRFSQEENSAPEINP